MKSIKVLILVAVAAFTLVSINYETNRVNLSLLTLANIEALANGDVKPSDGFDINKVSTTSEMNGREYKKSVRVSCIEGGTEPECTKSCKYQLKDENDNWTDWMPC